MTAHRIWTCTDHDLVKAIIARRRVLGIAMRGEGFRVGNAVSGRVE